MSQPPLPETRDRPEPPPDPRLDALAAPSRIVLILACALLAASFVLISPPRGETYPGALPWSGVSVLRPLIELMSLGGLAATARGVEIKDLAFHVAAVVGLALLAARAASARSVPTLQDVKQPWLTSQLLLTGWVALSALSALWSGAPSLALGQATLYGLGLAWALALAWTLSRHDVVRLLKAVVFISAIGAALCVWYYYERNPFHRPGFPVGNPGTLAAAIVPAVLIALCMLCAAMEQWVRFRRLAEPRTLAIAVAALVLLGWCFGLTGSRSAMVGLGVGLATVIFLLLGLRTRWIVIAVMLSAATVLAAWMSIYARLDAAMARSATIRFRFYAWRYAAELWEESWFSRILGHGAGAYPRLAAQLSTRDRLLDPAAFMGDLVEHAHNDLFEVFAEIGLVGGVTFVGGMLALLVAGGALNRAATSVSRRWFHRALVASVAALLADAMFSPSLRLPVVPAVFFTLVGACWAVARATPHDNGPRTGAPGSRLLVASAACGLLALGGAYATVQNWRGIMHEYDALQARDRGRYAAAIASHDRAAALLLDPVRQIINRGLSVHARLRAARGTCEQYEAIASRTSSETAPSTQAILTVEEARQRAITACERTYLAAGALGRRVPTVMRSATAAAAAAELLAQLVARDDAQAAQKWAQRAESAWRVQRVWRPYDFEALLALVQHTPRANDHIRLLRDALRATRARDRWGRELTFGQMRALWQDVFRHAAATDGFRTTLNSFLAAIGPAAPATDLDSLIASRAPETYRLTSYYEALGGKYNSAAEYAARAATLYGPMRPRFPELQAIALLEQALFSLRAAPEAPERAERVFAAALDALPVIQQQKAERWLREFHHALAETYLGFVRQHIRQAEGQRPYVRRWLDLALEHEPQHALAWGWRAWLAAESGAADRLSAVLERAAAAGVPVDVLARIRSSLCQEFPERCDELGVLP